MTGRRRSASEISRRAGASRICDFAMFGFISNDTPGSDFQRLAPTRSGTIVRLPFALSVQLAVGRQNLRCLGTVDDAVPSWPARIVSKALRDSNHCVLNFVAVLHHD